MYREKSEILDKHIIKIDKEYEIMKTKLTEQLNTQKVSYKEDVEKITNELQSEIELKQVIIEKGLFEIEETKDQLRKLIKLTEHPRLVEELRHKFHNKEDGAETMNGTPHQTQLDVPQSNKNEKDDKKGIDQIQQKERPRSAFI